MLDLVKYLQAERKAKIRAMWNGMDYTKYIDKLRKRVELLNQLYMVYPYLELQAEYINGTRSKLFPFDSDPRLFAPAIHYRILPNEIVIDLDKKDVNELKKIVKTLKSLNAKPFIGFSGNRGFHVHLIVAPPKGNVEEFATHPEAKNFTQTLFQILLKLFKANDVDVDAIDTGVMLSSSHTIRSFYSVNLNGKKWKTPAYGDRYEVWVVPKQLYLRVLKELEENGDVEIPIENGNGKINCSRIRWIEWILKNPDKIVDGRRILLMYAIIPYLVNVRKMSVDLNRVEESEVYEICMNWIKRTPDNDEKGSESEYRSLIKSEIKSYVKSGVLPMSRKKLFSRFSELKYLLPHLPSPNGGDGGGN